MKTFLEWAAFLALGYLVYCAYLTLPVNWQNQVFGAGGAALAGMIAPLYVQKWVRFRAKIWTDRTVIQETDSGRPPHFEVFLSRKRPLFWRSPICHLVMPWIVRIGRVNSKTGSISVTDRFTRHIAKTDPLRWNCGTNEQIKGEAAQHIMDLYYDADTPDDVKKVIDTLISTNIKLVP